MSDDPPSYPWHLIEVDYKAGVLPVSAILKKYPPLSMYRLLKMARERNWIRMPPSDSEELSALAEQHPLDPDVALIFDPEFLRKAALVSAAVVVETHRADIAKLRHLEQTLLERLGLYMSGTISNLPFKLQRESPSEVLARLSQVMYRRIELERQSFGLSAFMPPNPDEPTVAGEVKVLMERIEQMTRDKSILAPVPEPE